MFPLSYWAHEPQILQRLWRANQDPKPSTLLGGSWVVISGGYKSPNMGYKYSYPTYNLTSFLPMNLQVGCVGLLLGVVSGSGACAQLCSEKL